MLFNLQSEKAQGIVEFAFILVLIAVVVILVLITLGPSVGNMYSQVVDLFP